MGQIVAWISETGAFFSFFVADIPYLPFVVPELSVSPGSLIKKRFGGQHRNPVRTSLLATVYNCEGPLFRCAGPFLAHSSKGPREEGRLCLVWKAGSAICLRTLPLFAYSDRRKVLNSMRVFLYFSFAKLNETKRFGFSRTPTPSPKRTSENTTHMANGAEAPQTILDWNGHRREYKLLVLMLIGVWSVIREQAVGNRLRSLGSG
jgi:hypothetical protein